MRAMLLSDATEHRAVPSMQRAKSQAMFYLIPTELSLLQQPSPA